MNIEKIFEASELALRSRLEAVRAAFEHAGLKGSAIENAVKLFFEENLPNNIAIGSGVVVDASQNVSRQLDLIFYDRAKTPMLFSVDGAQIVPIECVYFVVEIKTSLSRSSFDECVQNMDSVKGLTRSAYYHVDSPIEITKTEYPGYPSKTWETIFLVVALSSTVFESTVLGYLEDHRDSGRDIRKEIDTMFVLDHGTYTNYSLIPPNSISADLLASESRLIGLLQENSLLGFLGLFSRLYNQADIGPPFDFTRYIQFSKNAYLSFRTDRSREIIEKAADSGFVGEFSRG